MANDETFRYDPTPMNHAFPGQPDDCFDMVNQYGTYNIQKTADTDNAYPAIAQGDQPLCLNTPQPSILFSGFQDSGIAFTVGAWCERDNYAQLRMDLAKQIKKEFDKEGISIPFPIISIDARNNSIPVTLVSSEAASRD